MTLVPRRFTGIPDDDDASDEAVIRGADDAAVENALLLDARAAAKEGSLEADAVDEAPPSLNISDHNDSAIKTSDVEKAPNLSSY